jgi:large repetitive protein
MAIIAGTNNNDTLIGTNSDDLFYGYFGNDSLDGGDGNDTLYGYYGSDTLQGGNGADTYRLYSSSGSQIQDTDGVDSLILNFGQTPSLGLTAGTLGTDKIGNSLIIDLDRSGTYDAASDLTILDYFSTTGGAGAGVIESIGNLSSTDILNHFTPPNTPPILNSISVTGIEDTLYTFNTAAFTSAFTDANSGDSLTEITITTLPNNGILSLGGTPVTSGQIIPVGALNTLTFTPSNNFNGTVSFNWNGSDGTNYAASDANLTLTIGAENDAPVVSNPIANQSAVEDQPFSFAIPTGTFSDVDGDTLAYTFSGLPSWLTFNAGTFSGTPANGDVGAASITVTATDSAGASVTNTFNLSVGNVNDAPTVSNAIADQTATEDQTFTFAIPTGTFVDVDGDTLSYSVSGMPSWLTFDAQTGTFSGTPANGDVGTASITVTATDGSGATVTDAFSIAVGNVNDAPTVSNAIADQTATEDDLFSFTLPANTFADVDSGDTLTYSATGLPSWLTFDAQTGTFNGTPANGDLGTASITVTAQDSSGTTVSDTFNIAVSNVNDAPTVANAIANQTATEDQAFSFIIPVDTFLDVDAGDTLTYSVSGMPSWLTFDAQSGSFSGTPANGDVGNATITVTATDTSDVAVTNTFNLTVANTNDAPTVSSAIADQTATEDQTFSFVIPEGTFADIDAGDTLNYSVSGLPNWLSFNAQTGTFTGTPDNSSVGATAITVTATDSAGATVSDTFNIAVVNVNDTPTAQNDTVTATLNQPLLINPTNLLANDIDIDGDVLSITSVGNATNGTVAFNNGNIVFTPTSDSSGLPPFNTPCRTLTTGHPQPPLTSPSTLVLEQ